MPNVEDIVSIAEALEKSPIAVSQDRCVVVRNRNASCRRCIDACMNQAIELSNNELDVNASLCNGCGACVAACPTEALIALNPVDAELASQAAEAMGANADEAVLACARVAAKHVADPAKFARTSCLARVDESLLVALVAYGANDILLIDGDCATCKYGKAMSRCDEVIESARMLLSTHGSDAGIERASGFPERLCGESVRNLQGTTRRGFFSEAVGTAKETALVAAQTTIAKDLGYSKKPVEIGERLRVTEGGTLPLIRVRKHERVLDSLDRIGNPSVDVIDSRLFGKVSIEPQACNACGMCAVFCPTGALRRPIGEKAGEPLRELEFSAADCIACGLCADVCWKGALKLSFRVDASELYDFEPVVIDISAAGTRKSKSLFS